MCVCVCVCVCVHVYVVYEDTHLYNDMSMDRYYKEKVIFGGKVEMQSLLWGLSLGVEQ